jgi:hypothetical protein
MRETLSINKLYKTLLIIVIVVGPIYWLMFTTDGKRRTDTMMLWLFSGESIEINFQVLDSHYHENDWMKVYPDLSWQCKDTESSFGSRVCFSAISSYNGIPANYLSVFFSSEWTSAVKLGYRDQYHSDLGDDLLFQLGQPDNASNSGASLASAEGIFIWSTPHGQVFLKQSLQRGEEPVLLWLAARKG